jgi:predicted nucleic acid-binding protein
VFHGALSVPVALPGLRPLLIADVVPHRASAWVPVDEVRELLAASGDPAFDDLAAQYYGRIVEAVYATGRTPRGRVADLMIAAAARAHDAAVVTHNVDDFAGLERMVRVIPA